MAAAQVALSQPCLRPQAQRREYEIRLQERLEYDEHVDKLDRAIAAATAAREQAAQRVRMLLALKQQRAYVITESLHR